MKTLKRIGFLFMFGGCLYYCMEWLFKMFVSHGKISFSMFIVGGLCFVLVGLINEVFPYDMPLALQALVGACVITCVEYVSGVILNIWLGMGIWDYSDKFMNLRGQVCLQFSILWFILCFPAIVLDDYLRYVLFGEEKPHYRL